MDNGQEEFHDVSIDNRTFDENINDVPQVGNSRTRPRPRIQSDGNTSTSVYQRMLTVEGNEHTSASYGENNAGFIEIKKTPVPVPGAYLMNVLPVPALDCYSKTPAPSVKVRRRVKHPKFYDFGRKIESFTRHNWPLVEPSAQNLAKADMFYSGPFEEDGKLVKDQVTCYKCGRYFRQWEENDDPIAEHRKIYPACFEENWILRMSN